MARIKSPTCTHVVQQALVAADDFMSVPMLIQATSLTYNQVNASLHHLRNRRAADCIIDPHGRGWWYPTPDTDDRTRHLEERVPESVPRKPRTPRKRRL